MASRTIKQGCQGIEAQGGDCSGSVVERTKTVTYKLTGITKETMAMLCDGHASRMGFPVVTQRRAS